MKNISELLKGIAIIILGGAIFGGGVYLSQEEIEFYTQSTQTEGTIIGIDSKRSGNTNYYYPVVSFESEDGNTYTISSKTGTNGPFDHETGEKIKIRYLKEKPTNAKIDNFMELWGMSAILLAVGLVFFLAGVYGCYNFFHKIKLRKELPRTGKLIKLPGRVESKLSKNKTEFVVVAEWLNPGDSKMYVFTSDKISYDPTSLLTDKLLDVWIDPMSPKKRYYVDVSFLPERS